MQFPATELVTVLSNMSQNIHTCFLGQVFGTVHLLKYKYLVFK